MDAANASTFRDVVDLAGGIVLMIALGTSLLVQVDVWRAVVSNGDDDEHDDFKIRTEQRRQQHMGMALEHQKTVVAKLILAHEVLREEKLNVTAMHDHTLPKGDQANQTKLTFANPLQGGKLDEELDEELDEDLDEATVTSLDNPVQGEELDEATATSLD